MNTPGTTITARLVKLKTFTSSESSITDSVAAVEEAVNAWLATAGEARIVGLHWSIDGTAATAAVWYVR